MISSPQSYPLTSNMNAKRLLKNDLNPSTTNNEPPQKKRKGFSVGPTNLPDGTYRRKTQKIKADLIAKAKVRQAYAKVKAQHAAEEEHRPTHNYAIVTHQQPNAVEDTQEGAGNPGFHPDRAAMLAAPVPAVTENTKSHPHHRGRQRPQKPDRYAREREIAADRRVEQQRRTYMREARLKERQAMAKAKRPSRDGRMKLGRQSKVLLGRVERLRNEGRI